MSFLLLSGALLTANPVYRIEPNCYFSTTQALVHAPEANRFHRRYGILDPINSVACSLQSEGIEITTLDDYQTAFRLAAPRLEGDEQHAMFSSSALFFKQPEASSDAPEGRVTAKEGQSLTEEDYALHTNDGDAGSSVFSVMNATIPTASALPPIWKSLLSQQTQSESFIFPLTTALYVTSPYGLRYHPVIHSFMRHEGTDFRAAMNSNVMSIADGVVTETGYGPVTGFYVTISHKDGWNSRYLHLNRLNVSRNQVVQKGSVIGLSGNTGRTNGPHLHLEIGHNNRLLDPMTILFELRQTPVQDTALIPAPAAVAPQLIDMTPTIAVVVGEGKSLQIGVRVGRKMTLYAPNEPVETEQGSWRIVKKFGKYKLVRIETSPANDSRE